MVISTRMGLSTINHLNRRGIFVYNAAFLVVESRVGTHQLDVVLPRFNRVVFILFSFSLHSFVRSSLSAGYSE